MKILKTLCFSFILFSVSLPLLKAQDTLGNKWEIDVILYEVTPSIFIQDMSPKPLVGLRFNKTFGQYSIGLAYRRLKYDQKPLDCEDCIVKEGNELKHQIAVGTTKLFRNKKKLRPFILFELFYSDIRSEFREEGGGWGPYVNQELSFNAIGVGVALSPGISYFIYPGFSIQIESRISYSRLKVIERIKDKLVNPYSFVENKFNGNMHGIESLISISMSVYF